MMIIKFCILLAIFVISNQSNGAEQKNEEKKNMIIYNIFASKWFENNKSKLISINDHELLLKLKHELTTKMNTEINESIFRRVSAFVLRKKKSLIFKLLALKWFKENKKDLIKKTDHQVKSRFKDEWLEKMKLKIDSKTLNESLVLVLKEKKRTTSKFLAIKWFEKNKNDLVLKTDHELKTKLKKELVSQMKIELDQNTFNETFSLILDEKNRIMPSYLALKWLEKNKNYLISMSDHELKSKLKHELTSNMNVEIDQISFEEIIRLVLNEKIRQFSKSVALKWFEQNKNDLILLTDHEVKSKLKHELTSKMKFKIDPKTINEASSLILKEKKKTITRKIKDIHSKNKIYKTRF